MPARKTPFFALLLLSSFGLSSCLTLTVQGRVSVRGNEPFTYLSLVTQENEEYALVGPLEEEVRREYQGSYIKLRGQVLEEAKGPGFPAQLEVEEILEVKDEPF